jgi:hypothetical protein
MLKEEQYIYDNNKYYIYRTSGYWYGGEFIPSYTGISFMFDENKNLKIGVIDEGSLYESETINFQNKDEYKNLYHEKHDDQNQDPINENDIMFYYETEKYCKKTLYIGRPEIHHSINIFNNHLFLEVYDKQRPFPNQLTKFGFKINTKLHPKCTDKIDLDSEVKKIETKNKNTLSVLSEMEHIIENYDDLTRNEILDKLENIKDKFKNVICPFLLKHM